MTQSTIAPPSREEQRRNFIQKAGWGDAEVITMMADAGSRAYYRLKRSNGECVYLMDVPTRALKLPEFINVGNYLRSIGINAPKMYDYDLAQGFLLLEDFGDKVYGRMFDEGADKKPYMEQAIDVLIHLHKSFDVSQMAEEPAEERARYNFEMTYFTDWYIPGRYHHETSPDVVAEYQLIWRNLFDGLPPLPKTLVMIDYHAPNLMEIDGKTGLDGVGVIDFQDSVIGSPAHDVMTLLEDDRRDLDPAIRAHVLDRYFDAMGDTYNRDDFELHMAVLGAHRHSKNMANFVRIPVQTGRERFLKYIPQATAWFDQCIDHPYLEPLKKWFDRHCPDYNEPMPELRYWKNVATTPITE